jgi:regulator of protease activity HflC (stomatin/prohibitin superfamily)
VKDQTGRISVKIFLFLAFLVLAFFFFSFIVGKKDPIKDNEVGVLVNRDGTFRIFKTGDKPFAFPFLQNVHVVSTEPVVVTLVDDEAAVISSKDGKEFSVESQITYLIDDMRKTIEVYGFSEPHDRIREKIREIVSKLLQENIRSIDALDDSKERVFIIAQMHMDLNELLADTGINISSYQLRSR